MYARLSFFGSPFPLARFRASQRAWVCQVADAIHKQIADLSRIVAGLTHGLQTTLADVDGQLSLRRGEQGTLPSKQFELPEVSLLSCTEAGLVAGAAPLSARSSISAKEKKNVGNAT